MMKTKLSLLVALLLCGCATQAGYTRLLETWVNLSADELIQKWGPPQAQTPLSDGGKVITYVRSWTTTSGGYTYYVPQTNYYSGNATTYGISSNNIQLRGQETVQVPVYVPQTNFYYSCTTHFSVNQKRVFT